MRIVLAGALFLVGCGVDVPLVEDSSVDESVESERGLGVLRINECRAGPGGYIELVNVSSTMIDLAHTGGSCWYVDDDFGGSAPAELTDGNVHHLAGSTLCAANNLPANCARVGPGERVWVNYAGLNAASKDRCRLAHAPLVNNACGALIDEEAGGPTNGTGCYGRLPDTTGAWMTPSISCTPGGDRNDGSVPSVGVIVNEFKAGTTGFVELFNTSSTATVDLSGYAIDDIANGGAAPKVLPAGTSLAPRGRVQVAFAGINVGSADEIRVVAPGGAVVDSRSNGYLGASLTGKCFGRSPDGAGWSALPLVCSPGVANPSSRCPGGTYAGVAFTADEECKAIDFLNFAKGSDLSSVMGANIPYDCAPDGTCSTTRKSAWQRLDQVTQFAQASACNDAASASLAGLKSASATFTQTSPQGDTIASVWANRTALKNHFVTLDRVVITETIPNQPVEQSCAVARDTATGAGWITVCEYVNPFCDCRGAIDWSQYLGKSVFVRGQLEYLPFVQGGRWVVRQSHTAAANGSGTACGSGEWFSQRP
jgi:hypothetical protein